MRAREFLIEYRRDITAQKMGERLLDALAKVRYPARGLGDAQFLTVMGKNGFDNPTDVKYEINVDGYHTLTPDNAKELYEKLKPNIINKVIDYFEERDPTPNKQYTPWMLQAFINGPNAVQMEDYNGHDLLAMYHKFKGTVKPEHRDINRFRTYRDFLDAILPYDLHAQDETDDARGDYKEIYKDDTVRVIQPLDQKAACYYGRGTIWCTAATKSRNYFDDYTIQGPLYIMLPTNRIREKEKYQLHFATDEFTDENNDNVALTYLVNKFPAFFAKLLEDNDEIKDKEYIAFTSDEVIEGILRAIQVLLIRKLEERIWEQANEDTLNDSAWAEQMEAGAEYQDYLEYNEEAKNAIVDFEEWTNLSAEDIRNLSDELYKKFEDNVLHIDDIPNLIHIYIVDRMGRKSDDTYFMLDWLTDRVKIIHPGNIHKYNQRQDFKHVIKTNTGWLVADMRGYSR